MAGSVFAMPAPLIMPKAQAAHFCRLLINDGESIAPLSSHAHRLMAANDSLTSEQIFASYIFRQSNWITLRIFPHTETDGTIQHPTSFPLRSALNTRSISARSSPTSRQR